MALKSKMDEVPDWVIWPGVPVAIATIGGLWAWKEGIIDGPKIWNLLAVLNNSPVVWAVLILWGVNSVFTWVKGRYVYSHVKLTKQGKKDLLARIRDCEDSLEAHKKVMRAQGRMLNKYYSEAEAKH